MGSAHHRSAAKLVLFIKYKLNRLSKPYWHITFEYEFVFVVNKTVNQNIQWINTFVWLDNLVKNEKKIRSMQSVYITTNGLSSNATQAITHYVITFVSDLPQVDGFLRFPPPIKLTTTQYFRLIGQFGEEWEENSFSKVLWPQVLTIIISYILSFDSETHQMYHRERRGRERMLVRFTNTYAISIYHH
jgi:hypothetical protein